MLAALARDWQAAAHEPPDGRNKWDRNRAAAAWLWVWLAGNGVTLDFGQVAAGIVADGLLIGASGAAAYRAGGRPDTGAWKPGQQSAATDLVDVLAPAAAASMAVRADEAATQLADSYVLTLGRLLVDGDDAGQSPDDVAAALAAAVRDREHARLLVQDQVTRAGGRGSSAWCSANGVEKGRWLTEHDPKVCPNCELNGLFGPVPIGLPYPSGDIEPPAHPNCRCALVPEA